MPCLVHQDAILVTKPDIKLCSLLPPGLCHAGGGGHRGSIPAQPWCDCHCSTEWAVRGPVLGCRLLAVADGERKNICDGVVESVPRDLLGWVLAGSCGKRSKDKEDPIPWSRLFRTVQLDCPTAAIDRSGQQSAGSW